MREYNVYMEFQLDPSKSGQDRFERYVLSRYLSAMKDGSADVSKNLQEVNRRDDARHLLEMKLTQKDEVGDRKNIELSAVSLKTKRGIPMLGMLGIRKGLIDLISLVEVKGNCVIHMDAKTNKLTAVAPVAFASLSGKGVCTHALVPEYMSAFNANKPGTLADVVRELRTEGIHYDLLS